MFKILKKNKKNNKGFTLVELVIVVAILAILVGLLAPQYTKYVDKSRKAADASNMDEMVKVVKIYAADPANDLPEGKYIITISSTKDTNVTVTSEANKGSAPDATAIKKVTDALNESIPNWLTTTTKSKKWNAGTAGDIQATITVNDDGGTSVDYTETDDFNSYMKTGAEKASN